MTPSTFTVNVNTDNAVNQPVVVGSLRWAIQQANLSANAPATITFAPSPYPYVTLQQQMDPITQANVTIAVPTGQSMGIYTNGNQFRDFTIQAAGTRFTGNLYIEDGNLTGTGAPGAGISITSGDLTLSGVTVMMCYSGSGGGGGVYVAPGAALTATACTFYSDGSTGNGGAVLSAGTVTLANCLLGYDNAVAGGGVAVVPTAGQTAGPLTVTGTLFSHCTSSANGGGVDLAGGTGPVAATFGPGGTGPVGATYGSPGGPIAQTTFTNCSAANGGGVYLTGGASVGATSAVVANCTTPGLGAGLDVDSGSSATLTGLSVDSDTAANGGGGVYVGTGAGLLVNGGDFTGDTAGSSGGMGGMPGMGGSGGTSGGSPGVDGGGVFSRGGTVTLAGVTFHNDQATDGGGVAIEAGGSPSSTSSLTVTNCQATAGGGGMYIATGATLTDTGSHYTDDTTAGSGGGLLLAGGTATLTGDTISQTTGPSGLTGAVVDGGGLCAFPDPTDSYGSSLTTSNVTVSGCSAGGSGGGVYVGDPNQPTGAMAASGGAGVAAANIRLTPPAVVPQQNVVVQWTSQKNDVIRGNTATAVGGTGGGVNAGPASKVTLNTATLDTNNAPGGGGGVYVDLAANLTVSGGVIENNTTPRFGGGILSQGGNVTVSGAQFINDKALGGVQNVTPYGGGIAFTTGANQKFPATLDVTGATFTTCTAANGNGGGVYVGIGGNNPAVVGGGTPPGPLLTATIGQAGAAGAIDTNFNTNCSAGYGGGVYVATNSTLTLIAVKLDSCTATQNGGGVGAGPVANLLISGSTLSNDTTQGNGGGIYASGSRVRVINVTFTGDKANGGPNAKGVTNSNGGGICILPPDVNTPGTLAVTASSFTNCTATTSGGGVFVGDIPGATTLTTATFGPAMGMAGNPADTTFMTCTAVSSGGAIWSGAKTTLTNCAVTGCKGGANGFAIYQYAANAPNFNGNANSVGDILTLSYDTITVNPGDYTVANNKADVAAVDIDPLAAPGKVCGVFTGTIFVSGVGGGLVKGGLIHDVYAGTIKSYGGNKLLNNTLSTGQASSLGWLLPPQPAGQLVDNVS